MMNKIFNSPTTEALLAMEMAIIKLMNEKLYGMEMLKRREECDTSVDITGRREPGEKIKYKIELSVNTVTDESHSVG